MKTAKYLLFIGVLFALGGCQFFQPKAYFFISNETKDKTIDIQVKSGEKSVFSDSIHYTDVRPDLQYTRNITLSKGKYMIVITADSGRTQLQQPITFDHDSWIFISYGHNNPVDSAQKMILQREKGYDSASVGAQQTPSAIRIFVTDKKPAFM